MDDCCSSKGNSTKQQCCPECNQNYSQVSALTVRQHIKQPWNNDLDEKLYYFCQNSNCPVVYYGSATFHEGDCRLEVGLKNQDNKSALLCYCFDISYSQFENDPSLKQYVIQKTKSKQCSCQSQNPSGRCCLKDFP